MGQRDRGEEKIERARKGVGGERKEKLWGKMKEGQKEREGQKGRGG